MADTNETIADIIAEKRRQADEIERDVAEKMKRNKMISDRYARELVADIRREADRLEAAHRRERGDCAKLREADHNWDAICEKCSEGEPPDECRYYGEPSGCNSPMYGKHPKPFGENAAVLRSAIIEILSEMEDMAGLEVGRKYKFSPDAMVQQCRDALSAPPRNCDVGTAQEQDERFHRFCVKHHTGSCAGCHNPVGDYTVANGVRECALVWAQMPYEEGGAK